MENILFGQFVILIVKMTYTRSISYCFSAPVKICYANEYMLVLHLNICVTVNKAICVEMRHDKDDLKVQFLLNWEGLLFRAGLSQPCFLLTSWSYLWTLG